MSEWYIVDTRTNEIVNCVTTASGMAPAHVLERLEDAAYLALVKEPTRAQLEGYRYWNERP